MEATKKSYSVTRKRLGEEKHTWISSATVSAYVVAGHTLNEILKSALVPGLLALAHESRHDSSRSKARVNAEEPVLFRGVLKYIQMQVAKRAHAMDGKTR